MTAEYCTAVGVLVDGHVHSVGFFSRLGQVVVSSSPSLLSVNAHLTRPTVFLFQGWGRGQIQSSTAMYHVYMLYIQVFQSIFGVL